jgi:hypothetical protein
VSLGGAEIILVPPEGMVALRDIDGEEARAAERQLEEEVVASERLLAVFAAPDLARGTEVVTALVSIDREMETAEVSSDQFQQVKEGMRLALRAGATSPVSGLPVYRLYEDTPRAIQVLGLMPLSRDEVMVAAMSVALVRKRVLGVAIFGTARSAAELGDLQQRHAQWVRELLRRNPDVGAALAPDGSAGPRLARPARGAPPGWGRAGAAWRIDAAQSSFDASRSQQDVRPPR